MDALRGLAILLVVLEHSTTQTGRFVGPVPEWLDFLCNVLNPLRIPMLAFLSGLLVPLSMAKGARAYIGGKIANILYPYVLWSIIYITVYLAMAPFTRVDHEPADYLRILYAPPGTMWYLHHLFLYYIILLTVRDLPRPVLIAGALLLSGLVEDSTFRRFVFLFAFFTAGDWLATRGDGWTDRVRRPGFLLVAGICAAAMVPAAWYFGNIRYTVASVPMAAGGIALLIAASLRIGSAGPLKPVRFLGRKSLVIYIVHGLFAAAAAVAAGRVLDLQSAAAIPMVFAAALGGPILLALAVGQFGLEGLFSWPSKKARIGAAAPAGQADGHKLQ
jgi:fucose 4-O-acetylase-like acetyltransferase